MANQALFEKAVLVSRFSKKLTALAQISLNSENATGSQKVCEELAEEFHLVGLHSISDFLKTCAQLCEKISKVKTGSIFHDNADLIFKASLVIIEGFLAEWTNQNITTEKEQIAWYWVERFSRFEKRIHRMMIESQLVAPEAGPLVPLESKKFNEGCGDEILKLISNYASEIQKKIHERNKERSEEVLKREKYDSPLLKEVKKVTEEVVKKFRDGEIAPTVEYQVFRLMGRRYAVPIRCVRGVGKVVMGSWLSHRIQVGQNDVFLCDLKSVLGLDGEAGGVFVALASRQDGVIAFAVDGVEKITLFSDQFRKTQVKDRVKGRSSVYIDEVVFALESHSQSTPVTLLNPEKLLEVAKTFDSGKSGPTKISS